MLRLARRAFRFVFPRLSDPLLDTDIVDSPSDARYECAYSQLIDPDDAFRAGRYFEGKRWRQVLSTFAPPPARVLDVGAGDGAVELALAGGGYFAVSVELLWNDVARRLGVRRVIADAARLPFRQDAFDAVVCLETIEHSREVRSVASEMSRVAYIGAPLLLTTPARWRFAFVHDPHFGIRGLLLLPAVWQRRVASCRGFNAPEHYVDRIYGSVTQIQRALSPFVVDRVLSRSRAPRRWFWDAVLLRNRRRSD